MKHGDYTVGWICALPIEKAVAEVALDVRHDPLSQRRDDINIYSLGSIGAHNVAIACLPAGVTGTISAAVVAIHMRSTFGRIKFSLMVGIGGGVPGVDIDIRLGDVVVSTPDGTFGGVVQYDSGKTVEDGLFIRTGSSNKPPTVLLSAVSSLRAKHLREDVNLATRWCELALKYPKLGASAIYQGTEHDQLFEAEYDHPGGGLTCKLCDVGRLVRRPHRSSNEPEIHYGLIASGNQVIKNGSMRERSRKELHMLCFEMEAAGLMDYSPCLVIRGICDYADSHKNNRWQPYAAATAAAYATELLQTIPGSHVADIPPVVDQDLENEVTGQETSPAVLTDHTLSKRQRTEIPPPGNGHIRSTFNDDSRKRDNRAEFSIRPGTFAMAPELSYPQCSREVNDTTLGLSTERSVKTTILSESLPTRPKEFQTRPGLTGLSHKGSKKLYAPTKNVGVGKKAKSLGRVWSPEEDDTLLIIARSTKPVDWAHASQILGNRSPYACQKRFEKLVGA